MHVLNDFKLWPPSSIPMTDGDNENWNLFQTRLREWRTLKHI